jgi:uncharacterized membrane protein YfhO
MKKKPVKRTVPKNPQIRKQDPKKEIRKESAFNKFVVKNEFWLALGLTVLLIIIIFNDFILGNSYYLFKDIGSDSINLALPQLTLLTKYLHTGGFPMWSFSQGMGQNIMPSLSDPFNWIVIAFGTGNIAYGFIWMELIKMVLTAIFFYLFLKQLHLSSLAVITGTLLYTFSGFIIIGSGWNIFSAEACFLALLLLGFEKLYQKGSWYIFPVAVALIAILQPFDLYFYGLFLVIYFLFRHFTSENPSWKKLLSVSLKMAGLGLLGVMISSFYLVSIMQMLLDSPRVSGNSSYAGKLLSHSVFGTESVVHNGTAIMRFFSNDLLGNGSKFKGWYNYLEAPMVYIGLLPLLLFPQVFIYLNNRKRIFYGIFLAIFFIPIVFPFFRYAFWLFTGDYYRGFSLLISIVLLLFSLEVIHSLDKVKKINLPLLLITLAGLIGLLYYPFPNIDQVLEKDLRSVIILFLIIYSGIIAFMSYSKNRDVAKILLLCVVLIEIGYLNSKTLQERVVLTKLENRQKTGYNDYSIEASAFVRSIDKGFFRVHKDYASGPAIHFSSNDGKIQDYFSTLSYTSFNQKYYIRFLEETGCIEKGAEFQTRWAPGFETRPFLQTFGSGKYNFIKTINSPFRQFGFDSLTQLGDVKIYKNHFFLPLGFTYDTYIPLKEFKKLSVLQKQFILFRAFVAEEPLDPRFSKFKAISSGDTANNYNWNELAADINARKADTLQIALFSNNRIKGSIDLKKTKLLFFSIPYDKGWHGRVDGKDTEPVLSNIGFLGFCLDPGKHAVELFYKPPYFNLSIVVSVIGLLIYFLLIGLTFFLRKKNSIV